MWDWSILETGRTRHQQTRVLFENPSSTRSSSSCQPSSLCTGPGGNAAHVSSFSAICWWPVDRRALREWGHGLRKSYNIHLARAGEERGRREAPGESWGCSLRRGLGTGRRPPPAIDQRNYTGLHNYTDNDNYIKKRLGVSRLGGVGGFRASWPADPPRLTFCTSDGTLDRKSSTSLLSMPYGFLSFFVNLLTPETDINTCVCTQTTFYLQVPNLQGCKHLSDTYWANPKVEPVILVWIPHEDPMFKTLNPHLLLITAWTCEQFVSCNVPWRLLSAGTNMSVNGRLRQHGKEIQENPQ